MTKKAKKVMDRDRIITERAEASAQDVMDNGPRFWVGRQSYILARGDGRILAGGLGIFGRGAMWIDETMTEVIYPDGSRTSPDSENPTYAEAPYDPGRRDDFGCTGRATNNDN